MQADVTSHKYYHGQILSWLFLLCRSECLFLLDLALLKEICTNIKTFHVQL